MKIINKQKFLAELGRLLTFMYEEDRQRALAMYNDLFDSAANEQSVLQFLVSPTRQAVVIARVYDAKDRKLQVHAESRSAEGQDDFGETPAFVETIEKLHSEALSLGIAAPAADANQFSLFEDDVPAVPAAAPAGFEKPDYSLEEAPEEPVPAEVQQDDYESSIFDLSESGDDKADETEPKSEETSSEADFAATEEAEQAAEESDAEPEESAAPNAVDEFIASLEIKDDITAEAAPAPVEEDAPAEEVKAEEPEDTSVPVPAITLDPNDPVADDFAAPAVKKVRKARPLLLALYIIFLAIPLGAIVAGILTVPAALFFSLAGTALPLSFGLFASAFGSFAMLADMLVVLGAALVLLALGLLFAWLFVWCIVGGIIGFIRLLCRLGRKWCYKEVAAQ